jgi:hypothetical protein
LNIAISESGDVAFVHMLHLDTGTMDLDNERAEQRTGSRPHLMATFDRLPSTVR